MNNIKIDTLSKNTNHRMIEILNNNKINEETVLDFSTSFFRPFSTLLLISTLKKEIGNKKINYIKRENDSFDMGLYNYLDGGYNEINIYKVNSINPFQITTLDINQFFDLEGKIMYDRIVKVTNMYSESQKSLLNKITEEADFIDFFSYAFRELLRNSIEHSYGRKVTIMQNYIKGNKYFEFSIFDDGRGLEYSLSKNKKIKKRIDKGEDVITIALEPGQSSFDNYKYVRPTDIKWKNSGFGLAIIKEMCMELNGVFTICSKNKIRMFSKYENKEENFECNIDGVGIQIRFHLYDSFKFKEKFNDVIKKLEAQGGATASLMSKRI